MVKDHSDSERGNPLLPHRLQDLRKRNSHSDDVVPHKRREEITLERHHDLLEVLRSDVAVVVLVKLAECLESMLIVEVLKTQNLHLP